MRTRKFKKLFVVFLSAVLCLTAATGVAWAADSSSGGTPPSGGAGGTPPSGMPSGGGGTPPSGMPSGGGGADTMTYDYTGTLSGALTADGQAVTSDGETISADTADENAALAENGGTLTLTNGTLTKSGDDTNGDSCNFYGVNSILLAVGDGSAAYVSDSSLSASSEGSNGIFATDGATVYAKGDTISTTADNSRGLDATYGGTIVADDLDITTQGDHCAAIATDRGGGNISVTNSTLSTAGSGSPLLYSTGDIEVCGVTGTAAGSQIAGMEGLNTILIYNSSLTSTITSATASDPVADGVIIYQSTSGDAESTTGETADFEAYNSTLKSAITSGAMFYITNTTAKVVLSGTVLDFDSGSVNLLTVEGNDSNNWGTAGSNGAAVTFTGLDETLSGDISVDTISSLDLYLLENTTYTGAISITENAVNTSAAEAPVTVNLDGTSAWIVTGDSTVTNLNAAAGSSIVDEDGKTVTIAVNGQTVVQGDSAYTVTVTGSYTTSVTTGEANALSTDLIDRTAFDSCYAVSTAFSAGTAAQAAETPAASASAEPTAAATETPSSGGSGHTGHTALYAVLAAAAIAAVGLGVALSRKKKRGGAE
jgi:hypothetical protein